MWDQARLSFNCKNDQGLSFSVYTVSGMNSIINEKNSLIIFFNDFHKIG